MRPIFTQKLSCRSPSGLQRKLRGCCARRRSVVGFARAYEANGLDERVRSFCCLKGDLEPAESLQDVTLVWMHGELQSVKDSPESAQETSLGDTGIAVRPQSLDTPL